MPNVPSRGSRIASAGSPPASEAPTPSATSPSPSRGSAAVAATPNVTARTAAANAGTTYAEPHATSATSAPIAAPTAGNSAAPRRRSPSPTSTVRPTGTALRNEMAASTGRVRSGIGGCGGLRRAGHARRVERGRGLPGGERDPDPAEGAGGARARARPEPEVEQGFDPERGEDQGVAGFRRTGGRDQRVSDAFLHPNGHQRGRARDEPIEQDRDPPGRGAERHADEERDLEAADRGED